MLDVSSLVKKVHDHFGPGVGIETAASIALAEAMDGKRFRSILEIGTMHGMSAAILAHYADKVTTIDIEDRPIADEVLCFLEVKDRVHRLVVKNNDEKERIVARTFFDMAFLDGNHTRYGLCFDFAITRRCGCVLFHDYPVSAPPLNGDKEYMLFRYPGTPEWGDGSGFLLDYIVPAGVIERQAPFAWWRASNA